jgi:hypothetical protein
MLDVFFRFMGREQIPNEQGALHEPGTADPAWRDPAARRRVPAAFLPPMRNSNLAEVSHASHL